MSEGIDTSKVYRFEENPAKVLGYIVLALALAGGGVLLILKPRSSFDDLFWGWVCALSFGSLAANSIFRFFTKPSESITLSPEGLHATRFGPDLISWSDIRSVGVRSYRFNTYLTLHLSPEADERIRRNVVAKVLRIVEKALGLNYVTLPHYAADVPQRELRGLLAVYARAHGGHTGYT